MRMTTRHACFWLGLGALLTAWPGWAGTVLDRVQSQKVVRCGVSEGIPGFSVPGADGRWTGMDADFCRAVAAAAIGDPDQGGLRAADGRRALSRAEKRPDRPARTQHHADARAGSQPGDGVRRDALLRRPRLPGPDCREGRTARGPQRATGLRGQGIYPRGEPGGLFPDPRPVVHPCCSRFDRSSEFKACAQRVRCRDVRRRDPRDIAESVRRTAPPPTACCRPASPRSPSARS